MKLLLNITFILLALQITEKKVFALTNYQIKEVCRKSKNRSICIKNLQEKRLNLFKGKRIEIPVIPFKK